MQIKVDSKGNPVLDQFSEDGFVDLTFRISNLVGDEQHYRFRIQAVHHGEVVGADVALVKGIESGFDANMNLVRDHVYRQGVRFLRTGIESDRLVAAIAELYGLDLRPSRMVDEEAVTAIALHKGPLDWPHEPVKLKLFGRDTDPVDENDYYESFFNVDFAQGFIFWNEKDQEYRVPLAHAFSVA